MHNKVLYDEDFYRERDAKTRFSARTILGLLMNVYEIHSAVDLGCGVGTWLSVVREHYPNALLHGYDGDYVNREYLQIKEEEFFGVNLEDRISENNRFDLAISLEVAEHLKQERAKTFVEDLTLLSDVVLFSAAVPKQPGTGHINCQLASWWGDIFHSFGYEQFDIVRGEIWNDVNIPVWYRQNILVYVKSTSPLYAKFSQIMPRHIVDIIHPDEYVSHHNLLMKQIESFQNSRYVKFRKMINSIFDRNKS